MHELWPSGGDALGMPVQDLAARVLQTIDSARLQERGITTSRGAIIASAVNEHWIRTKT
jgi:hypothetical protein